VANAFVSKGTVVNPLPDNAKTSDKPVSKKIDADCGYAVLSRADPTAFDRSRQGIEPREIEGPNIAFDED